MTQQRHTREVDIAEVRERIATAAMRRGGRLQMRSKTDPFFIGQVLDHVSGDVEMAADALLLEPRPLWLRAILGYDLMAVYPARCRS